MPFKYEPPPAGGELRQGELLGNVWEHRSLQTTAAADEAVQILAIRHPFVMVMTADCDLLWDFRARPPTDPAAQPLLLGVTICDLFDGPSLRQRFVGASDIWRRVNQNQDERYHHLEAGQIGEGPEEVAEFYLDFKKAFCLHPEALYEGLTAGAVRRVALMPPIYMQNLMHRFYGFASRVAVPD